MNVSPQRGIYSRRFAWAIGAAFSYVYFVELPGKQQARDDDVEEGWNRFVAEQSGELA